MAGSFQSIGYAVAQSPLIKNRSFVANNPRCHHGKVGTNDLLLLMSSKRTCIK